MLDRTFDTVALVGHPLALGNLVNQTAVGAGTFTGYTNTYSPYLLVGDDAFPDPAQDRLILGTTYQEVLTAFPLGSTVLTGLFLRVTSSDPQASGAAQTSTVEKTLLDRIGFAARQGDIPVTVNVSSTGLPAIDDTGVVKLDVATSSQSPQPLRLEYALASADYEALTAQVVELESTSDPVPSQTTTLARAVATIQTGLAAETFS